MIRFYQLHRSLDNARSLAACRHRPRRFLRGEDILVKTQLVRSFVSSVVAIAMALLFGGCIVPRFAPVYGGGWNYGWGGGFNQGWGGGFGNGIVVRPPNAMVVGPGATVGAQQAATNYQAAAIAGGQQTGPYIVGANPTNPYGVNQTVPLPGMLRIQTGCTGGQWYVPTTGTCSGTAWIPGVNTVWVPNGGVVEVPANQMGPAGGVQGVPGATMPMVPGGFNQGFNQPMMMHQPFVNGW